MKEYLINLFYPFGTVKNKWIIVVVWIVILFLLAIILQSPIFPTPFKILGALFQLIQEGELWSNFMSSLIFILKGMLYAILVTMFISYLSTIEFFKPVAQFVSKLRYLSYTGVVFLFTMISSDSSEIKTSLLVFGVVPYFTTSMLSVINSISESEINKNFVNRRNKWEALLETVIIGRFDQLFEVLRQNFAIAWMMITMIEAKAMGDGGIGVMLLHTDKYLGKLHIVFALLIIIVSAGVLFDWFLKWIRLTLFEYVSIMRKK